MQTYCVRAWIRIYHGSSSDQTKTDQHTIEIASYIQNGEGDPWRFPDVEESVSSYLNGYAKKFLNEMPEFHQDASIENIGEVFFAGLTERMRERGMFLRRLEIGETPLRQYVIYCQDE